MLISALFRLSFFKFNAFVGLLLRPRKWNFTSKKKTFGQTGRKPFFDLIVHLSWCMVFICFSSVCLLFVCAKETHFLKVCHLQHNKELLISFFSVLQDGEEIIKDFLSQVAKLPVENMTEEQTACEVSKLKENVLAKNNPYIQELLAK